MWPGETRIPVRAAPIAAATASTTSTTKRMRPCTERAVAVRAQVGVRGEELVQQVAVRCVQLDAVEAGRDRVACRGNELVDQRRQLRGLQRARRREILQLLLVGPHLAGGLHGRRRDRASAIWRLSGCAMRPQCMNCMNIFAPRACTASVTPFHAAICSGVWMPGVRQ